MAARRTVRTSRDPRTTSVLTRNAPASAHRIGSWATLSRALSNSVVSVSVAWSCSAAVGSAPGDSSRCSVRNVKVVVESDDECWVLASDSAVMRWFVGCVWWFAVPAIGASVAVAQAGAVSASSQPRIVSESDWLRWVLRLSRFGRVHGLAIGTAGRSVSTHPSSALLLRSATSVLLGSCYG